MRTRGLIQIVAVAAFLVGCASTAEKMAEKGVEPMTAEELRTTITGNSFYQRGDGWEWAGYFKPDGTATGRAWGSWGEVVANGTWDITDDGLQCEDWENEWGGDGRGCSHWYQDGDLIVYDHVSGSKGQEPTGTLKFSEGNAYNL